MVGCLEKLPGVVPALRLEGLFPRGGSVQRFDGLAFDIDCYLLYLQNFHGQGLV